MLYFSIIYLNKELHNFDEYRRFVVTKTGGKCREQGWAAALPLNRKEKK